MSRHPLLTSALLVFLSFTTSAMADTIIPHPSTGGASNAFPWFSPMERYQHSIDSVPFESIGEPILIEQIAYAPGAAGTYSGNITINLGYTANSTGLTTNLDGNITNPVQVFSDPAFSQAVSNPADDNFSLVFDFSDDPFLYDPTQGDLIVELVMDGFDGPNSFLASGNTRRAYQFGTTLIANSGSAPVVQFTFTPQSEAVVTAVPEPAGLAIFSALLGLAVTSRRLWRRNLSS